MMHLRGLATIALARIASGLTQASGLTLDRRTLLRGSGAALATGAGWQLHVSLAVAAGFAVNVFVLTPRINFYRDCDLDGDAAAKRIFGLLHLASVAIFLAQLAGSLAIVGMFLYAPV